MLTRGLVPFVTFLLPAFGHPTTEQQFNTETDHFVTTLDARTAELEARTSDNHGFLCMPKQEGGRERASCYHEVRSAFIYGESQRLSPEIECDTRRCSIQANIPYISQQSFSIDVGANVNGDLGAPGVLKGAATDGETWSWQTASVESSIQGYSLQDGDKGHMLYWPFMRESCGDLAVTPMTCPRNSGCIPQRWQRRKHQVNASNACGLTPVFFKAGASLVAGGVHQFCLTGGPRKGQGCDTPSASLLPV